MALTPISITGPIIPKPSALDMPTDGRCRVSTLAEIEEIANPFVGMLVYCTATGKYYTITALNQDEDGVGRYEEFSGGSGGDQSVPDVVSISDAAVTIASMQGNKVYRCTASGGVTSLTVTAFDASTVELESIIELTTAANFSSCSFPSDSKFAPLEPVLSPSTSYVLSVQGKIWVASPVTVPSV